MYSYLSKIQNLRQKNTFWSITQPGSNLREKRRIDGKVHKKFGATKIKKDDGVRKRALLPPSYTQEIAAAAPVSPYFLDKVVLPTWVESRYVAHGRGKTDKKRTKRTVARSLGRLKLRPINLILPSLGGHKRCYLAREKRLIICPASCFRTTKLYSIYMNKYFSLKTKSGCQFPFWSRLQASGLLNTKMWKEESVKIGSGLKAL